MDLFVRRLSSCLMMSMILILFLAGTSLAAPDSPQLIAGQSTNLGASINSLGETVYIQYDSVTGHYQVFSSQRGQLSFNPGQHESPAINNLGDVVWVVSDPATGKSTVEGVFGGRPVTFVSNHRGIGKVDINDHGEVVWVQADFPGDHIYSNTRGQLTSGPNITSHVSINNNGDIAYLTFDGVSNQVYKLASGSSTPVAITSDSQDHNDVTITDGGEIIWTEGSSSPNLRIVSSTRGVIQSATDYGVDANSCGDVIYYSFAEPYGLYRVGNGAPCASIPGSHATRDEAAPVALGDVFRGVADSSAAPVQWYRFDTELRELNITVNFDRTAPNSLAIGLYDAQGNFLSGPTSTTPYAIVFPVPSSGSYFLRVENAVGSVGYTVAVENRSRNCGANHCWEWGAGIRPGSSISINSLGEVLWSQYDWPNGGWYEILSSQRGPLTSEPLDHASPAINDAGDTVWATNSYVDDFKIEGVIGGKRVTVATPGTMVDHVDINNRGEVVWRQGEGDNTESQIYSSVRGQLTSGTARNISPSINNLGDVVFIREDPAGQGNRQIIKIPAGSTTEVVVAEGANYATVAINDLGELVWAVHDTTDYTARLVSSLRGTLANTIFLDAVDINNCGDVIYTTYADDAEMLYRLGNSTPCSTVSGHDEPDKALDINAGGTFVGSLDAVTAPATWYRFDAAAGDSISITTNFDTRFGNGATLNVYDQDGFYVTGNASSPPAVQLTAPTTGTYYFSITGSGLDGFAFSYAVSVKRSPPVWKLIADGMSTFSSTVAEVLSGAGAYATELKLFCRSGEFTEDIAFDTCGRTVTVGGGYDSAFSAVSGKSSIQGAMRISCGKVVADGLTLK